MMRLAVLVAFFLSAASALQLGSNPVQLGRRAWLGAVGTVTASAAAASPALALRSLIDPEQEKRMAEAERLRLEGPAKIDVSLAERFGTAKKANEGKSMKGPTAAERKAAAQAKREAAIAAM